MNILKMSFSLMNIIGFVLTDVGKSIQDISAKELYQEVISNEPKYRSDITRYLCKLCVVVSKEYNTTDIKELSVYIHHHSKGLVLLTTCVFYIAKCEYRNINMSESVDVCAENLSKINHIVYKIATSIIVDYTKRNNNGYNYHLAYSHAKRYLTNMTSLSLIKLIITDVKWICDKLHMPIRSLDVNQAVIEIGKEYRGAVTQVKEIALLYNTDDFGIIESMVSKLYDSK